MIQCTEYCSGAGCTAVSLLYPLDKAKLSNGLKHRPHEKSLFYVLNILLAV